LKSQLDLPDDRIILWGASYGTLLAATAFASAPNEFGGVILLSSVEMSFLPDKSLERAGIKLAFHGGQDVVCKASRASEELKRVFGRGCEWTVFEKEGHVFHRTQSWATVYTKIIESLSAK
jgi:pimeloyl-ACP methyl ester carboxylesterase